ncbi:hypothetical protein GCM10020000_18130 [Streptomyces olivoverticillatus]
MRTAALYGTLGSLVLSGLTGIPVAAAPALVPGGVAEARGVAVAAAQAAAAGIDFGACPAVEQLPSTVECGTFSVPVDYAHPGGRHIRLTVSRARAQGSARQGALVLNPGGPGGNGMFYPLVARLPAWRNIADAYDIIGYAPRGVGRSAPLSCVDPASYVKGPTQAPEHPSAAYKKERIAEARAYAQGCARKAGGSLRHFTSLNNARDLDVLRAALGEQKLTYMGASYGTYFGALYATLFPGHVRRMVFDSVVNPDPRKIWYGNNLEQSAAFERRFGDWRRWVARHDSAYHLGRTPQQVLGSYEKVSRRLSRRAAGGNVGPAQLPRGLPQVGLLRQLLGARRPRPGRVPARRRGAAARARRARRGVGVGRRERERRLHGRRVQRRVVAAFLVGVEPGQRPARRAGAVRDVEQRLHEPAVRLLAGAATAARRHPRGPAGRAAAHAAAGRRAGRGHPVQGGAGAPAQAGPLLARHRTGRGQPRHRGGPQRVRQPLPGQLPGGRRAPGPTRLLRPPPGTPRNGLTRPARASGEPGGAAAATAQARPSTSSATALRRPV